MRQRWLPVTLFVISVALPANAGLRECLRAVGGLISAVFSDGGMYELSARLKPRPAPPFTPRPARSDDPRQWFRAQLAEQNPELLTLAMRLMDIAEERGVRVSWGRNMGDTLGTFSRESLQLRLNIELSQRHPAEALFTLYHEMIHVLNATNRTNPVRVSTRDGMNLAQYVLANREAIAFDEARAQAYGIAMREEWVRRGLVRPQDVPDRDPEWTKRVVGILKKHGQLGKLAIDEPALREVAAVLKSSNYRLIFEQSAAAQFATLQLLAKHEGKPLGAYDGVPAADLERRFRAVHTLRKPGER